MINVHDTAVYVRLVYHNGEVQPATRPQQRLQKRDHRAMKQWRKSRVGKLILSRTRHARHNIALIQHPSMAKSPQRCWPPHATNEPHIVVQHLASKPRKFRTPIPRHTRRKLIDLSCAEIQPAQKRPKCKNRHARLMQASNQLVGRRPIQTRPPRPKQ